MMGGEWRENLLSMSSRVFGTCPQVGAAQRDLYPLQADAIQVSLPLRPPESEEVRSATLAVWLTLYGEGGLYRTIVRARNYLQIAASLGHWADLNLPQ